VGCRATDLGRSLVLAQTFIDHLTQQVIVTPGQVFDLDDKLRSHPMDAVQDERFAESAFARWGTSSGISDMARGWRRRHSRWSSAWSTPVPAAGIDQPSVRIVVGEQQRP
jgi:hypothetical protein